MGVVRQDKRNVPIWALRMPRGFNVRTEELTEEEEARIAASIQESGLIHDASVEERIEGEGKKRRAVYDVTDGFGRMAGVIRIWKRSGSPKDWTVTVNVVTYDSRVDPFMRNLVENVHRRELKTADLAKRLWELSEGACPDPRGGWVSEKVSVKKLAETLLLSESLVREYIRAWGGACPALRDAWRSKVVRTDHVRAWCRLSDKEQRRLLEAHRRGEDTIPKPARSTPAPSAAAARTNGASTAQARSSGVVQPPPGELSDGSVEEEGDVPPVAGREEASAPRGIEPRPREARQDDGPRPPSRAEVLARAEALGADLDSGKLKGSELVAKRAAWQALRWAAGEVRSMRLSS